MTDTKTLCGKIKDSGFKRSFIAEKCGITYQSLLNRLNGSVEFRIDEVRVLQVLLNLTEQEVIDIFFA